MFGCCKTTILIPYSLSSPWQWNSDMVVTKLQPCNSNIALYSSWQTAAYKPKPLFYLLRKKKKKKLEHNHVHSQHRVYDYNRWVEWLHRMPYSLWSLKHLHSAPLQKVFTDPCPRTWWKLSLSLDEHIVWSELHHYLGSLLWECYGKRNVIIFLKSLTTGSFNYQQLGILLNQVTLKRIWKWTAIIKEVPKINAKYLINTLKCRTWLTSF